MQLVVFNPELFQALVLFNQFQPTGSVIGPNKRSTQPSAFSFRSTQPFGPTISSLSGNAQPLTTVSFSGIPHGGGPPCSEPSTSSTTGSMSTPVVSSSSTDSVVETMTRLLQAQADVMADQAKAATVQHLPALPCFTGEGDDVTDDGFDKWLKRFQERAKFAGWSESDQLYHLKLHLDKTALDVFRMLPDSEKLQINSAISALQKRFQSGGIEELRDSNFIILVKEVKPLSNLAYAYNSLEEKPSLPLLDKTLTASSKDAFIKLCYLVKWQRKLGAPKADETFHDLYA